MTGDRLRVSLTGVQGTAIQVATEFGPGAIACLPMIVGSIFGLAGLFTVHPNEAKVGP